MFKDENARPQVKCDVENCAYNDSKCCCANSIKVGSCGDSKVESCDGTKCSTFKKDNSCCM